MPALPIALQLYTIRDPMKADLEKALAEVAAIGYSNVEIAGLHGRTAQDFKRLLDQHGLKAISAHVPLNDLQNDLPRVIGDARTLGYDYVMCPWIGEELRSPEGYRQLSGTLNEIAGKLDREGLTLGYHNHDFEFRPMADGRMPEDLILGEKIACELDVYWVQKAGQDPLAWMKKLAGRLPILHMKDMADTPEKGFAEVGTGTVPLKQIAQTAPDHGVRYLVVEQDSGWIDGAPMKSARIGYENLRKMLD